MAKVLIAAAHPDDELLGVGGTILRHVQAGDVVTIQLADRCRQPDWGRARRVASIVGASWAEPGVELRPEFEIIYTHHLGDLNAEHRAVAERALVLGRFARTIRTFETVSSTEWGLAPFVPDYWVNIDLNAKLELLSIYADEMRPFPHPRSYEAITALAAARGSVVGFAAAEAFVTVRDSWK